MRAVERIPILLDIVRKNEKVITEFLKSKDYIFHKPLSKGRRHLKKVWTENPDLRFVQLLIAEGYISAYGVCYNVEDEFLFVSMKLLNKRDICFWGVNYNQNGDKLLKTEYKPISKLNYNYIVNIIEHNSKNMFYVSNFYIHMLSLEKEIREVQMALEAKKITKKIAEILIKSLIEEQNK